MWYAPTIVTAATGEPLTSDQVKAQTRVDFGDDDTLITRLITAARAHVEKRTGTFLMAQTVDAKCDYFTDMERLAFGPVTSITSVKYIDGDGVEQTLLTDVYELRQDGITSALVLKYGQNWPAPRHGSQITVRAVVGYATLPPDIAHAMLSLVAHWYEHREAFGDGSASMPVPMLVDDLLINHRLFM